MAVLPSMAHRRPSKKLKKTPRKKKLQLMRKKRTRKSNSIARAAHRTVAYTHIIAYPHITRLR